MARPATTKRVDEGDLLLGQVEAEVIARLMAMATNAAIAAGSRPKMVPAHVSPLLYD